MKRFYFAEAVRRAYDEKIGTIQVQIDRQSCLTEEEQIEVKLYRHYGPFPYTLEDLETARARIMPRTKDGPNRLVPLTTEQATAYLLPSGTTG